MGFLKQIGKGVLNFFKHFGQTANLVLGATAISQPGTPLGVASGIILTVEKVFANAFGPDAHKGTEKAAAAVPLIADAITQSEWFWGKSISDPVGFNAGVQMINDGVVKVLNSITQGVAGSQAPSAGIGVIER